MTVTSEQVVDALRPVQDPELHRSIVDLGMVRETSTVGPDGVSPCWSPSPSPAARCATRSPAGSTARSPRCPASRGDRPRLHRDDRPGAAKSCASGSTATRPPPPGTARPTATPRVGPSRSPKPGSKTRPLLIASGKGGVGKSSVTTNLAVALAAARALRRRRRRRRLRLLHPAHARHRPRPGGDRPDAPAARDMGRALHLDRLLRPRRPGGHLARPDAAQGARAVPHRRVLGRPGLPARRHAAGHRRHRFRSASSCPGARCTWSPRRSRRPRRWPGCRRRWPRRCTWTSRASSRTCRGSPATTASATRSSARGGGQELADELGVPLLGQIPLLPRLREGGDDGQPITAVEPESGRPRCSATSPSASPSSSPPSASYNPALRIV